MQGEAADGRVSAAAAPAVLLEDEMPYRLVRPYRVRFDEATAAETVRTAVYLAWLADVAWQHSAALGFGRDWYSERGLFWLVRAIRLDVHRPLATYGDALVSTQVMAYRRVAARRESEIRGDAGDLLAVAQIDWVMTNERGAPTRVPADFHRFLPGESTTFEMHKIALPPAPAGSVERRFHVPRRDLDPMDHVNNSVYLDYMEEALVAAGQAPLIGAIPRRYVLDFAASAAFEEPLTGRAWPHEGGWAYRLSRADGTELFRATVRRL
jgi:acyl-CoA thioesterase FadM